MQNILVVGSSGYIGSSLIKYLLKNKKKINKIYCLDNTVYRYQKKNLLRNRKIVFIKKNFCQKNIFEKINKKIDTCIFLAGLVGDPITKKYPKISERVNYIGIKNFIVECNKYNIKKFIFISTCSNYGFSNKILKETSSLKPLSGYAKQKVKIENLLLKNKNKFKFNTCILRFATAFGLSKRFRTDLTVNQFCYEANEFKKITIFDPYTWRPYCHVKDFCRVINYICFKKNIDKFNIFNVGSNENNYRKIDIANLVCKYFRSTEIILQKKREDKRNYRVDFSKIQKYTKLKFNYNLNYGIKEIKNYLKKFNVKKDKGNFVLNKFRLK